jgi:site-specific recombinase XerD
VFNELIRQGEWNHPNPLKSLRKFKLDEQELAFLSLEEIDRLLEECKASSNPSVYHVTRLALATGARWSEAEGVTRSSFTPHRVTYNYTKSGKSRSVPISETLYNDLIEQLPFESCSAAFRKAVERAGIDLPRGQLTHVCRHTFASHFIANGGDILTLQKVLGHSDIKLTMRYAHLSPGHLSSVLEFSCI